MLADLRSAHNSEAALYRLHDGETLRIGMRELITGVSVFEVGYELSILADVCVREALVAARAAAEKRFGPCSAPFAILALGKAGGYELGYGSDLDLLFVYGQGEVESGAALSEFFVNVAQRMMRALKEPTRYGMLYEIDARLRPDGNRGALAVSEDRFVEYYEGEAEAWERLALVKARWIAGDDPFAEHIQERARNFAFDLELNGDALDRIEDIRQKIAEKTNLLDIKKCEGGLAEIEFALRLLQIKHASSEPRLRWGGVRGAIEVIMENGFLPKEDGQTLLDAYIFYRRAENRIRMMQGRPGSSMPEDAGERAQLAKRLGLEGELLEPMNAHRGKVHAIYRKILAGLN